MEKNSKWADFFVIIIARKILKLLEDTIRGSFYGFEKSNVETMA